MNTAVVALSVIIVCLVGALIFMMTRKPKTNVVSQKVAVAPASTTVDGIFGIPFTRGENEVLDFLDNVENRSSGTLRAVLCSVLSDEQLTKLIASGQNKPMKCKDVSPRLDKITGMLKTKVQNAKFQSDTVRNIATILVEEVTAVYEKVKTRLCTSGDTLIEPDTIRAIIKDAREKFCKGAETVDIKPIFADVTSIRSGKLT